MKNLEQDIEEKKPKRSLWIKILKFKMYFVFTLLSLLLVLGITLSLPSIQTKLGKYATQLLNEEFGTNITIEEANFTVFGGIKLKKVCVKDYKQDTLFKIKVLKTNILDFKNLLNGDLHFGEVRLDELRFKIINYKKEKETNLDKFIALFDDGKPSTSKKKFFMTINALHLKNSNFIYLDKNSTDSMVFAAKKLNAYTTNFKIVGPNVATTINEMSFVDNRGLEAKTISTAFSYTKKNILLNNLYLETPQSIVKGKVELCYKREDFARFNDKVLFKVRIDQAKVASNDLKKFYNEFGSNQTYRIKGNLIGPLNYFSTKKLTFKDQWGSKIVGDFQFKNLFAKNVNSYLVKGKFKEISSKYENIVKILPNILGKKLPSNLKKLGKFSMSGNAQITHTKLISNITIKSKLGTAHTNLVMNNIHTIDKAIYKGKIDLAQFDLGTLLNEKKIGKVNLSAQVDGKGFSKKYLDTQFKTKIQSFYYNKYNFKNILIDGTMQQTLFNGSINANDPNLIMLFKGFINLSKNVNKYNFTANVEYANLKKINLYTADAISIFRGNVEMNLHGSTIDNLYGDVFINKTSYENSKDTYFFDDFIVQSTLAKDGYRTIAINSPDIIEGQILGKFKFKEIGKLIENSLGSLYANYSPNKVSKGQYVTFNFNIYSKLIEVFYPEIALGENTIMKGEINSNNGLFKLNFKSPKIKAFDNYLDNIHIDIDNKNPLYNAYIEMDSIKNKHYTISKMNLINVTAKDTLFVRTEFKGGKKGEDYYNLNLYHTIDKNNKSVVGIKKSEVHFKNNLWFLNENETDDNKVVFNKKLTDVSIEKIALSHNNQALELSGILKNSNYKDLKVSFKEVDLDKITPTVENLTLKGKLNGDIHFKQENAIYEPTSTIAIEQFNINNTPLGNFNIAIEGDDSFQNFKINSTLNKEGNDILKTNGLLTIKDKKPYLDLDINLNDFDLSFFTPMGEDIVTNIRGLVTGNAKFEGSLTNPDVNGRFYLNKAGLKIPYLNIDYSFANQSIIDVTENSFAFQNVALTDTKYKTKGMISGLVKHDGLDSWNLDFNILSKRMLILDTKDHDEALYYGTAFMNGNATIKGFTNDLAINVNATSAEGTTIKIPINDDQATANKSYIKFTNNKELQKNNKTKEKDYNGLELKFELDITPVAEIEVIINKSNGHGLKGKGSGSLLMEINTLGKFNMWGDFQVYEGNYNFKYGGFIDKKFKVKNGGYISWDGDPLNATLNMEAIYKTEANPSILLDNPSFNKKIPTEVVIKLTDKLTNPTPEISINFPTISSVLRSELEYKLNDNDTRQTQALFLLSSGGFLSDKGVAENAITGNLLERANSLFEDIFANDERFKLGINYVQNDRNNIQNQNTGGRVGFTVSTQINDKITINGKLGVPVGGVNESIVVGDVEVQLRLNEDGSLKARVFNRENDITYLGQGGIGYTQGLGLSYEVDFNTFKELMYKILHSKKHQKNKTPKNSNDQIPDSDLSPDIIQFTEQRQKKSKQNQKNNEDEAPDIN